MTVYIGRTLLRGEVFRFDVKDTWELRKRTRQWIGLRRSTRMIYKKIGANSFKVETRSGRAIVEVYRYEDRYTGDRA